MTTVLSSGYTAAAKIAFGADGEFVKVSLTNYSASFHKSIIQSNAVWKHAADVNTFNRTRGPYLQDAPVVSCEVSFEPDRKLFQSLIQMIAGNRTEIIKVQFTDFASGVDWLFSECYLQTFSFNVSENTILAVTLSLFVQIDTVNYTWAPETADLKSDAVIPLTSPIPYYAWNISEGETVLDGIRDFSFSFTQQITPKYGCTGNSSPYAPGAEKLVFGLPSMEFGMTRVLHEEGSLSFESDKSGTRQKLLTDLDANFIQVGLEDTAIFKLTGITVIENSPSFDGPPSYRVSYAVNGKITV